MTTKFWSMVPGSLPVAPGFQLRVGGAPHMIYGVIRGPRSGPNLWLTFGCNITVVPEFCGGMYMTSANVLVSEFQPTYANTSQLQGWQRMLSTDDLFEWASVQDTLAKLPTGTWSRWGDFGRGTDKQLTALALEKIGAISLGTRMMALALATRRRSINFWDTKWGPTRGVMKWIFDNLARGVHYPDTYVKFSGEHDAASNDRPLAEPIGAGTEGYIHRAYPKKFLTGMYMRNANSGNYVATSTLYVGDSRRANVTTDIPPVHLTLARMTPQMLGLGHSMTYAPTRFYAM